FGSSGVIQVVVIAGEAALGAVGNIKDVMSCSCRPEDVVLEDDVLAAAGDLDGIGVQFHHRIVGEVHGAAGGLDVVELDASSGVVVNQVVGNGVGAGEG